MSRKWFLDTSYAIALAAARDALHKKSLALASEIERHRIGLVTTRAVVLEIGNALSKSRFRIETIAMLTAVSRQITQRRSPAICPTSITGRFSPSTSRRRIGMRSHSSHTLSGKRETPIGSSLSFWWR